MLNFLHDPPWIDYICVAHDEVTVWRENKYRSQPRDLSLVWISFIFCSTFQLYPSLYPNSYARGFLSNTVQLWPIWIFQIIQFFVPKLGSTTRPPFSLILLAVQPNCPLLTLAAWISHSCWARPPSPPQHPCCCSSEPLADWTILDYRGCCRTSPSCPRTRIPCSSLPLPRSRLTPWFVFPNPPSKQNCLEALLSCHSPLWKCSTRRSHWEVGVRPSFPHSLKSSKLQWQSRSCWLKSQRSQKASCSPPARLKPPPSSSSFCSNLTPSPSLFLSLPRTHFVPVLGLPPVFPSSPRTSASPMWQSVWI